MHDRDVWTESDISIHAPRVGCDAPTTGASVPTMKFQSTHPGWGATIRIGIILRLYNRFQSTHPGWGATILQGCKNRSNHNFNPRTPGGVRRYGYLERPEASCISIHAPRVGCDQIKKRLGCKKRISIHAPRVGCDYRRSRQRYGYLDFNPRTPGGVRRN